MRTRIRLLLAGLAAVAAHGPFTPNARADEPGARPWWAFVPVRKPTVPNVRDQSQVATPVDTFVLARLDREGLTPSPRADRLTLLRRVTYDLTGLPPTIQEQENFLADPRPDAYEAVVDRLLASPRYGERWARHWLDLVLYAESEGYNDDNHRGHAYKYRDYVIRAFNDDLPYDRFVRQQLAGDELEPDDPQAVLATGYFRLPPDETNTGQLDQRRQDLLDANTDTSGLTFLGLTVGCARCHDHKTDPILQTDYYQFQAFFAALQPRNDLLPLTPAGREEYRRKLSAWEDATAAIRGEISTILGPKRDEIVKERLAFFRAEFRECFATPPDRRTPYQAQIAKLGESELTVSEGHVATKLTPAAKARYDELKAELSRFAHLKPPVPLVMAATDIGRDAPPVRVLKGGDWRKPREEVAPELPSFLDGPPLGPIEPTVAGTGRRAVLARWLTRPDHPLTARVMVNRLWRHHFGRGLVDTPNDFGVSGGTPSHPELLDWLAATFVEDGWSVKRMHRLMVLSNTYRQSSRVRGEVAAARNPSVVDPENKLLWRGPRRRLEAEAVRDALLSVTGGLNLRMYGPSARPELPAALAGLRYSWKPDRAAADRDRRSVYVLAKRNQRYPFFDALDGPDLHTSCALRCETTTAPQALLLLNGDLAVGRALAWALQLVGEHGADDRALVTTVSRAAWGRPSAGDEIDGCVGFLRSQEASYRERPGPAVLRLLPSAVRAATDRVAAVADFCHAVLNTNEFIYID